MSDNVIIWDAPVLVKPEFRLYYDEHGDVATYTCDKLPGDNFIVIDASTFAQGRPDVKVIDGKISTVMRGSIVSKLQISSTGTRCAAEDISIIADDAYTGDTLNWKLKTYEL